MVGKPGINRRKVLKSSGIAISSISLVSGIVSAIDSGEPKVKFKMRGGTEDPVDISRINERRKEALREYKTILGHQPRISLCNLENMSGVLAYNFIVDEDSGVSEHLYSYDRSEDYNKPGRGESLGRGTEENTNAALTSTPSETKRRAHKAADAWFEQENTPEVSNNSSIQTRSFDEVQTQSFSNWEEWEPRGGLYHINEKKPYGVIIEDYALREKGMEDIFAVKTTGDVESGYNRRYNANDKSYGPWHIKTVKLKHDWNTGVSKNDSMRDRYPRGTIDNRQSSYGVSLGIDGQGTGSLGVSYTFTKNMNRVSDNSSQSDNIGRWKVSFSPHSHTADSNAAFTPGSLAQLDLEKCPSWAGKARIVALPIKVEFGWPFYWAWSDTKWVSLYEDFWLPCP